MNKKGFVIGSKPSNKKVMYNDCQIITANIILRFGDRWELGNNNNNNDVFTSHQSTMVYTKRLRRWMTGATVLTP
jgi:hypothetical protein